MKPWHWFLCVFFIKLINKNDRKREMVLFYVFFQFSKFSNERIDVNVESSGLGH